jgi:tryptophanase
MSTLNFRTIIEPFRIKSIESVKFTTRDERAVALAAAHYNMFRLHAEDVLIDLLTDSGTGAMSSAQWVALINSDESYAGSRSFYRFERVVRDLTGFTHIIPTHQGRSAERILFHTILHPAHHCEQQSLRHDPREHPGRDAGAIDLMVLRTPAMVLHPFRGNMDIAALEDCSSAMAIAFPVMVTVTNNSAEASRYRSAACAVRTLCDRTCRSSSTPAVLRRMRVHPAARGRHGRLTAGDCPRDVGLADGCTMSAKKDGLANIGASRHEQRRVGERVPQPADPDRRVSTCGRLAGYDLEAIARGLEEIVDSYISGIESAPRIGGQISLPECQSSGRRGATQLHRRPLALPLSASGVSRHRADQRAVRRGWRPRRRDRDGDVRAAS